MRISDPARLRRLHGVEGHRRRVGPEPWLTTGTPIRSPQRSSCSIAAARSVSPAPRMTCAPLLAEPPGELPAGGRLPGAVHADDEHDRGTRVEVERRLRRRRGPREGGRPARGGHPPPVSRPRARLLAHLLHERLGGVEARGRPGGGAPRDPRRCPPRAPGPGRCARSPSSNAARVLPSPSRRRSREAGQELHGWTSLGTVTSFTTCPAAPEAGQRAAVQLELDAARVAEGDVEAPGAAPLAHRARRERLLGRARRRRAGRASTSRRPPASRALARPVRDARPATTRWSSGRAGPAQSGARGGRASRPAGSPRRRADGARGRRSRRPRGKPPGPRPARPDPTAARPGTASAWADEAPDGSTAGRGANTLLVEAQRFVRIRADLRAVRADEAADVDRAPAGESCRSASSASTRRGTIRLPAETRLH